MSNQNNSIKYSAQNGSILHIGNILNNGYLHCKYLRKRGVLADCLNVDYKHCQGQPEWAEVYIKEPVDEFNPDWTKVDLKGFERPPWFYDVALKDILSLVNRLNKDNGNTNLGENTNKKSNSNSIISSAHYKKLYGLRDRLQRIVNSVLNNEAKSYKESGNEIGILCDRLIKEYKKVYASRNPVLSKDDILQLLPRGLAYSPMLKRYKLIHAYSLDPINVLLGNPDQPFICYEHGTMREFPFENSSRGRLYSLSLKKAEKVIITNADCNISAERLGLQNYVFIPHIIDDDLFKPGESSLKTKLKKETGCDFIFVAPSRHHWKNCPVGLENSWFKRNDILIRGLGRLFRNHPKLNALVVFFEWGQEVSLSKALINECGFSDRVRWAPIQSKPAMKEYYCAADIIIDQFNAGIGTFGAVVPEAMACAKPVILNYKRDLHTWCYPELPPVIHAYDEESIEKQVVELLENEDYRLSIGEKGRQWFERYHSSDVVIKKMIDVYMSISDKYNFGWNFKYSI